MLTETSTPGNPERWPDNRAPIPAFRLHGLLTDVIGLYREALVNGSPADWAEAVAVGEVLDGINAQQDAAEEGWFE